MSRDVRSSPRLRETSALDGSGKRAAERLPLATVPAKKAKLSDEPQGLRQPASSKPSASNTWISPTISGGGANRTGSFAALLDAQTMPHTLILGTQPSNVSLANGWYFGKDENAFWHIIGCGLGFRRGFHVGANQNARGDVVPSIAKFLPPKDQCVVVSEYAEAVRRLLAAGFVLWDILESSERKDKKSGKSSSLDSNIRKGVAAPIQQLVATHPSIRRIVFATGSGSAQIFRSHFGTWLESASFCCGNEKAYKVFGTGKGAIVPRKGAPGSDQAIELIVPPSVSPAAARFEGERNFGEKRDGWLQDVFSSTPSST
jgi:G:T/U-mismatch repair DNA glycosylase